MAGSQRTRGCGDERAGNPSTAEPRHLVSRDHDTASLAEGSKRDSQRRSLLRAVALRLGGNDCASCRGRRVHRRACEVAAGAGLRTANLADGLERFAPGGWSESPQSGPVGWSDLLQPGPRPAGRGPRALRANRGGFAYKQRPAASWLAQKVWRWSFPAGIGMPFASRRSQKHGAVTAPVRHLGMGWIREIGISGQSEWAHPMARISRRNL